MGNPLIRARLTRIRWGGVWVIGLTVVVPVYRGRRYLADTLQSIRSQVLEFPVEIIVVEDGSPHADRARDIAETYNSTYYLLEPNRGVAFARHYGATLSSMSEGFLMFLDQDDILLPGSLATMVAALNINPTKDWAVSNALLRFPDGTERPLYITKHPSLRLADLKMFNYIVTPSQVLIRLSSYRTCRDLPTTMDHPGADDWILWLALLAHSHQAIYIREPQVIYRMHGDNVSADIPAMRQSEQYVVAEWFPRLGFSRWDQRRYQARVRLDRLIQNRRTAVIQQATRFFAPDPLASFAALWYFAHHRIKGLV